MDAFIEGAQNWQQPPLIYTFKKKFRVSDWGTIRPSFDTTYLKCIAGHVPLQVVCIEK